MSRANHTHTATINKEELTLSARGFTLLKKAEGVWGGKIQKNAKNANIYVNVVENINIDKVKFSKSSLSLGLGFI